MTEETPTRLCHFPYVRVRVECPWCDRRGEYSLARLAHRFGPDIGLDELLLQLTQGCHWQRRPGQRAPGKYNAKCGARYIDLYNKVPPDDVPPPAAPPPPPPPKKRLKVIEGGKQQKQRND